MGWELAGGFQPILVKAGGFERCSLEDGPIVNGWAVEVI